MHKDKDKLKEEFTKKDDEFSELQYLDQTLFKDVKNLKEGKVSKLKKNKDDEINNLHKHNQALLNHVKMTKRYLHEKESTYH